MTQEATPCNNHPRGPAAWLYGMNLARLCGATAMPSSNQNLRFVAKSEEGIVHGRRTPLPELPSQATSSSPRSCFSHRSLGIRNAAAQTGPLAPGLEISEARLLFLDSWKTVNANSLASLTGQLAILFVCTQKQSLLWMWVSLKSNLARWFSFAGLLNCIPRQLIKNSNS